MKRFRNILYVHQQDPVHRPVLDHLIGIVGSTGARLTVVDVVEDLHAEANFLPDSIDVAAFRQSSLKDHREALETLVSTMAGDDVKVGVKVLVGSTALEIIREVIREGHDLVVKSASGFATGIGGRLFGSTAIKLMRKCPCPVWIVKPTKAIDFKRVLAAVDPDPKNPDGAPLNRTILSLAASIAREAGAHLDILHSWRIYGETLLSSGRTRMSEPEFEKIMSASEAMRKARFEALVAGENLSDIAHEKHLVKGFPELVIPGFVEASGVDLIVMGTVARTGIAGWITGNTAEKVLGVADCSVLAIKPSDFVSPITA